jgi:hypothetical protein
MMLCAVKKVLQIITFHSPGLFVSLVEAPKKYKIFVFSSLVVDLSHNQKVFGFPS